MIVQTYQKGRKQPTSHSCTELNQTVFPCEYRYGKKLEGKTFSKKQLKIQGN